MNINLNIDTRTKALLKNIGLTSVFRAITILINFVTVPILIKLLGTSDYGVWITISSILAWINFFDFGISTSLQNRIAKTIALGKIKETKIIISSTYTLISVIIIGILLLILLASNYVNWSLLLNIASTRESLIKCSIILVASSISLQIILKLVTAVLFAYQQTNLNELISLLVQSFILIAVLCVNTFKLSIDPLLGIAFIYSTAPVLLLLISNVFLFRFNYPLVSPSIKYVRRDKFKSILTNSSNFFFLQLYGLVLFQTDNIIVANLFNPSSVTTFSITSKYYSLITILFGVILMPYWSAASEAYALKEFSWLKKAVRRNMMLLGCIFLLAVIMILIAEKVIFIWTQEVTVIPIQLSACIALYTVVLAYNNIYGIILNVANVFRVQIIMVAVIIIINIPLSYALVRLFHFGLSGVVLSNLICVSTFGFFVTKQVNKLLNEKATGIWNQ